MVNFQRVIFLIFDEFLDCPVGVLRLLQFFEGFGIFPHFISDSHMYAIFVLKIDSRNTLWTLQKFKLFILYLMFVLIRKNLATILGKFCLKPVLEVWG